jgi:hypothetical protein
MDLFLGTKKVMAKPMSLGDYNLYRGWKIPEDENPATPGFLVEYFNGGTANHPDHAGYISWAPAEVFWENYRANGNLTFGHALALIKEGKKLARKGWNGKGQFVFLVQGSTFTVNRPPLLGIYPEGTEINYHAHIDLRNAQGQIVPWFASQGDMLSEDWEIVE